MKGTCFDRLPDLIAQWSEQFVTPTAAVSSAVYGEVPSNGWGTGRTGSHTGDAWALLLPGSSKLRAPTKLPHIIDIAPTICAVLGVDTDGLAGQPLLESGTAARLMGRC